MTSGSGGVPQGHGLDLIELNLSLENLLDLAFIWTLFHLLSSNQVQEVRGQDQVTFHCLWRVQLFYSEYDELWKNQEPLGHDIWASGSLDCKSWFLTDGWDWDVPPPPPAAVAVY